MGGGRAISLGARTCDLEYCDPPPPRAVPMNRRADGSLRPVPPNIAIYGRHHVCGTGGEEGFARVWPCGRALVLGSWRGPGGTCSSESTCREGGKTCNSCSAFVRASRSLPGRVACVLVLHSVPQRLALEQIAILLVPVLFLFTFPWYAHSAY